MSSKYTSLMEPRKQRLLPWLYQKIEDGKTPGLHWVDREQLIFQMPWVHVTHDAALQVMDRDDPDPTTTSAAR